MYRSLVAKVTYNTNLWFDANSLVLHKTKLVSLQLLWKVNCGYNSFFPIGSRERNDGYHLGHFLMDLWPPNIMLLLLLILHHLISKGQTIYNILFYRRTLRINIVIGEGFMLYFCPWKDINIAGLIFQLIQTIGKEQILNNSFIIMYEHWRLIPAVPGFKNQEHGAT